MADPVSLRDIRRIVTQKAREGLPFPGAPLLARTVHTGPTVPCSGPTVGRPGDGCTTCDMVAVPPYEPPVECPDDPCSEELLKRAIVRGLSEAAMPPLVVLRTPQEDPGYDGRSTPWTPTAGAVVISGGSAGANAAATAIRLGIGGVPGPTAIGLAATVNLGSSAVPTAIFTFLAPDQRAIIAKRLWLTASDLATFNMVQFSIEVAGDQQYPLANLVPGEAFPLNLRAQPGSALVVKAACLDSTLAAALQIRIDGWTSPVVTIDNSMDSLIHRFDPVRRRP